ncbi:MAG: 50S ribosomal protein L16 [Candidatus Komeilibacteria bacterium CG10_big_fil_rev_8_21_14_0_10_41_13]|uniref:Large ribosomal subunit protein uL16 n=1 Tax=Candidatus Komeilibacteria bacterium CG10_big_fil_rev_8_21_14_0_10_41_13 TaxID=1974476 RepID=A0A2M6WDI2_9BACT|nr:MAG: 50S ribosomal protein L16 [Candidatus Komeilibacteria bacterium CG10_big_fil_rev_8_21_14_0_10_41_13]
MLAPKKVKHRKWHRTDKIKGKAGRKTTLSFGTYGLKAITASWVTARQIESARRVMTRYTQRGGKIWIRIFPDKPMTKKGSEVPMGKGKGAVDHYVAVVRAGTVMFEMAGVTKEMAEKAMTLAAYKLPVKCKFISK